MIKTIALVRSRTVNATNSWLHVLIISIVRQERGFILSLRRRQTLKKIINKCLGALHSNVLNKKDIRKMVHKIHQILKIHNFQN